MGYGYWDVFGEGGRVTAFTAVGAGTCGAGVPDPSSAASIFTSPSSLCRTNGIKISLSGWQTGWREEITYHHSCPSAYRYNIGAMTPRGTFAFVFPVTEGFTGGLGLATVAQYRMNGSVYEYEENSAGVMEKTGTFVTESQGDINEALLALSTSLAGVDAGIAAGVRFGSGESKTYILRADYPDSTSLEAWEHSQPALRTSLNTSAGYTNLYASWVTGDDRYASSATVGAAASFPFMNGGYLGSEIGILSWEELMLRTFARFPGVVPGSSMYMGISGYRPVNALKTGLGLSFGLDYTFGSYRVSGAYHYQSRYREGTCIPISSIEHVYDAGHSISAGVDISL